MPLTRLTVDEGPHNNDGLLLHAWDGADSALSAGDDSALGGLPTAGDGRRAYDGRTTVVACVRKAAVASSGRGFLIL